MIADFKKDCVKRNAKMLFRIHWDGDFFNDTYAYAWKTVIDNNTEKIAYLYGIWQTNQWRFKLTEDGHIPMN